MGITEEKGKQHQRASWIGGLHISIKCTKNGAAAIWTSLF